MARKGTKRAASATGSRASSAARRRLKGVKSAWTKPERILWCAMRHAGITGIKPQHRVLRTRPDFAFPDLKVAIFVDGCFWHGCPEHYVAPTTNAAFWRRKITRNRANDRSQATRLRGAGWVVLRFWECQVKADGDKLARLVRDVVSERCSMLP